MSPTAAEGSAGPASRCSAAWPTLLIERTISGSGHGSLPVSGLLEASSRVGNKRPKWDFSLTDDTLLWIITVIKTLQ